MKINNLLRDKISVQAKASIGYTIASLLTRGINIISMPIFTRMLTTDEMGVTTTFVAWFNILYAIVSLSLTSASFNVAMLEFEKERDRYQAVCLQLSTITATVFSIVYFLFIHVINGFTTLSTPLMVVQILLFFFNPALDSWYARKRYEYQYKNVMYVSCCVAIISVVISIVLILIAKHLQWSNLGELRIFGQYIIVIIVGLVLYINILIKGGLFYDKKMIVFALKVSPPLIIHTLAKNILDVSDRLMIARICGNSQAGIYGTVYSISLIVLMVWNAINSSIIPYTFELLKEKNHIKIRQMSNVLLLVVGVLSIMMSLVSPEILLILSTNEYYEAVYMMPAVIAGVFMTVLYGLYGNLLVYAKKTWHVMLSTIVAAGLNLVLNYYCIMEYGYMAAAYTTLVSFVILAFCQGIMQYTVYREEIISTKYAILISLVTILLCTSCNLLYGFVIIRYIIFVLLLLLLFLKREKVVMWLKH